MADNLARLDSSLAAVPVAVAVFAAALIANVWLLAGLPVIAVPLGLAEVIYGWRLRRRFVATFRTLATVAAVGGAAIALLAAVFVIQQPVGHFGSTNQHTRTVTTSTP